MPRTVKRPTLSTPVRSSPKQTLRQGRTSPSSSSDDSNIRTPDDQVLHNWSVQCANYGASGSFGYTASSSAAASRPKSPSTARRALDFNSGGTIHVNTDPGVRRPTTSRAGSQAQPASEPTALKILHEAFIPLSPPAQPAVDISAMEERANSPSKILFKKHVRCAYIDHTADDEHHRTYSWGSPDFQHSPQMIQRPGPSGVGRRTPMTPKGKSLRGRMVSTPPSAQRSPISDGSARNAAPIVRPGRRQNQRAVGKSRLGARVKRNLKKKTEMRVSRDAAEYLSNVLKFLAGEYLSAGEAEAANERRRVVQARDLKRCLKHDDDLNMLIGDATIPCNAGRQFAM